MDHSAINRDIERAEQIVGLALGRAKFLVDERVGTEVAEASPSLSVNLATAMVSLMKSKSTEGY